MTAPSSKSNKKSQKNRSSPNIIINIFAGLVLRLYAFVKGNRLVRKAKIKGSALIVANHTSFNDFAYMYSAVFPHRVTFVAAAKYYKFRFLGKLLRLVRAIPKDLGSTDIRAINQIVQTIRNGGKVAIFPEGQISITGVTLPLQRGLGKLAQMLKVDIYTLRTVNAGVVQPPWGHGKRRGKSISTLELCVQASQLSTLTSDEIEQKIYDGIAVNRHDLHSNTHLVRGKELAEGLQNLLYMCPKCKSNDSNHTFGNLLRCSSCGNEVRYTFYGTLEPTSSDSMCYSTIDEWYQLQVDIESQRIATLNDQPILDIECTLQMYNTDGHGIVDVGKGRFAITASGYTYIGTLKGATTTLTFDHHLTKYIPHDSGRNFQIYSHATLYQFAPQNPAHPTQVTIISTILHQHHA